MKRVKYALLLENIIDERLEAGNSRKIKHNALYITVAELLRMFLLYRKGIIAGMISLYFWVRFLLAEVGPDFTEMNTYLALGILTLMVSGWFIYHHDFLFYDLYMEEKDKQWAVYCREEILRKEKAC